MMKILRTPPPASMGTTHTLTHLTTEQGGACTPEKVIKIKRVGGALHREQGNLKTDSLLMFG